MIKEAAVKIVLNDNKITVTPNQYGKIKKFCSTYHGQWNDHFVLAVIKLIIHFNGQMDDFVKKTGLGIQEAGVNLPTTPSPMGTRLMFKYAHRLSDVLVVLNSNTPWTLDDRLDDILVRIRQKTYKGKDPALEAECAKWGVDDWDYEWVEENWLSRSKGRVLSDHVVTKGDWTARFLDVDDPRALFLGNYVTCCQSMGEVGESAAIHGTISKYGRMLVVEFKRCMKLICWVWTHPRQDKPDFVVFDSLEYNQESNHVEELRDMVIEFIDSYVGSHKVLPLIGAHNNLLDGVPTISMTRPIEPPDMTEDAYLDDSYMVHILT